MAIRYQDFLAEAVNESIKAATESYGSRTDKKGKAMLEGAVAGLKACRDLSPPQLGELLERAHRVLHLCGYKTVIERYWRVNCFKNEVEWICNVVSVVLVNQGINPIVAPTMRAITLAARITQEAAQTN